METIQLFLDYFNENKNSFGEIIEILSQYDYHEDRMKLTENNSQSSSSPQSEDPLNNTPPVMDEKKKILLALLNSLCRGLQAYKIENALVDNLNSYDLTIQEESTGRDCFRSNDFARIPNLDDLTKHLKPDYEAEIPISSSVDNFTVSSDLNPEMVSLLDSLDEIIAKTMKLSEPEEISQNEPRKKIQKVRKVGKGGQKKGKKGELIIGDEEIDGSDKGENQGDDGTDSLSGKKRGSEVDENSSVSGNKKQIPKSAKWMTREGGSAGKSNVQPPEILRCLFNDLSSNGLIMKSIEYKLAALQQQTISNSTDSMDVVTPGDGSLYTEYAKALDEVAQKPIGRVASAITAECISGWHDSLDNFDNSWKEIYAENVERQMKCLQSLTSLRAESSLSDIQISSDIPSSDLLVNPFASIRKDVNRWDYLTQLSSADISTIQALRSSCGLNKPVDDPLCEATISSIRESKTHPFIHPKSLFYGKANVSQCLHEFDLKALTTNLSLAKNSWEEKSTVTDSQSTTHSQPNGQEDQSGIRTRKKRLHQDVTTSSDPSQQSMQSQSTQKLIEEELIPTYWEAAIAHEIPIPGKKIKLNVDECSSLVNLTQPSSVAGAADCVPTGACYQFCVERATALLNLGHNIIVVDKTPPSSTNDHNLPHNTSPVSSLVHRIRLISSIIRSNIGTIDYFNVSKSKKKRATPVSRWGPILIITKIKDLLTWEDILKKECQDPIQISTEQNTNNIDNQSNSNPRPLRLLSYYGNTTDRALLRSYLTSSSLYTERSPCHIILTHYEALLSDIYYFKFIRWQMVILDEGWPVVSNVKNKHLLDEINSLQIRHKILSCSSLIQPSSLTGPGEITGAPVAVQYPDIFLTIQFLFPTLWNTLDIQIENNSLVSFNTATSSPASVESVTKRLLQQLCASLTAICDEDISNLVHSHSLDTDEDTIQYYDIVENLPWYEWDGVNVHIQPIPNASKRSSSSSAANGKYRVVYDFKRIEYTNQFLDLDFMNEFNSIQIDNLGKVAENHLRKLKQKNKLLEAATTGGDASEEGKKKKKVGGSEVSLDPGENSNLQESSEMKGEEGIRGEENLRDNPEGMQPPSSDLNIRNIQHEFDAVAAADAMEIIPPEPPSDATFGKQAPPKVIKRKTPTLTSSTSSKPKAAVIRHFEPEEELLKSVAMRGDRWQVSLTFPGRVRFLGLFRTEEAAMKAYVVALQQRRVLLTEGITSLPKIKFVGDVIGGFEGSLSVPSTSSGKKKKVHEVFTEQEILERSSDMILEKSIADMIAPSYFSGLEIANWECPDHPPPAYAMLQGPKGFVAYLTSKRSVLGKFHSSTIELAQNVGIGDPIGMPGGHGDKHVDVHLGDEPSIARQHAIIKFNDLKSCFEIEALFPIFVQGEKVQPGQAPVPLPTRAIIQIGCKIFYFVLPIRNNPIVKQSLYRSSEPEKVDLPVLALRCIANVLLETIKLRRRGCSWDGSLIGDISPSAEEANQMNSTLDEITKLQEHLFPSPRGGKPVAAPAGNVMKKRVRDEELFMRSVISDSDKGLVRPAYPPSASRGPPGINPAVILKMGPPMLVGSPPTVTSPSEVDEASSPLEGSEQDASLGSKIAAPGGGGDVYQQHTVGTDDGIKYAKMPPALRPERPKKIEKPKGKPTTPQQVALQSSQISHTLIKKPEFNPRSSAADSPGNLPYPPYPRGPRGPLGPALPRGSLPRPIYQQIPGRYPGVPRLPMANLPGGVRPIYPSPGQAQTPPRQPNSASQTPPGLLFHSLDIPSSLSSSTLPTASQPKE